MGSWKLHDVVALGDDVKDHAKRDCALTVLHSFQLHAHPLDVHSEQVPHGQHQRLIGQQVAPVVLLRQQLDPYAHLGAVEEVQELGSDAEKLVLPSIEGDVRGRLEEVVKLVIDVLLEALVGLEAVRVGLVVDDCEVSDVDCLPAQFRDDAKRYPGHL